MKLEPTDLQAAVAADILRADQRDALWSKGRYRLTGPPSGCLDKSR